MNFLSNTSAQPAENTLEGTNRPERKLQGFEAENAYPLEKGTPMTVAVIPADGTEPIASFPDMATAMAWGLQQYKGQPFVVRVFADEAETGDVAAAAPSKPATTRRRPAAKTAAVASVLRAARKAEREEFRHEASSMLRAASH
jgi:hypothetical protein